METKIQCSIEVTHHPDGKINTIKISGTETFVNNQVWKKLKDHLWIYDKRTYKEDIEIENKIDSMKN